MRTGALACAWHTAMLYSLSNLMRRPWSSWIWAFWVMLSVTIRSPSLLRSALKLCLSRPSSTESVGSYWSTTRFVLACTRLRATGSAPISCASAPTTWRAQFW